MLDQKTFSAKEERIFHERTQGEWPVVTPYDLEGLMVPFYFVTDHNHEGCVQLIKTLELDLLVNATTLRILKPPILHAPTRGVVNCHPGMLPRYRGCTCVEWAIFEGQPVGSTAHFMSAGIDEGPIIYQESLHFSKQDNYHTVRMKVYQHSLSILVKAVQKIVQEELTPANTPPQGEGRYYRVIDEDKLQQVKQKLKVGAYLYQDEADKE